MFTLLLVLLILVAVVLIPVVLLQAGKGGGLALGYQLALTRHLVVNAALGFRAYSNWNRSLSDSHYLGDFNAVGQPGTVLDGQLSVGYAF